MSTLPNPETKNETSDVSANLVSFAQDCKSRRPHEQDGGLRFMHYLLNRLQRRRKKRTDLSNTHLNVKGVFKRSS